MINTKSQGISPTYKNRQATVLTYFSGLSFIAVAASLEQNFQIWHQVSEGVASHRTLYLLAINMILMSMGFFVSFRARLRFQDWGYPSANHSNFDHYDERQKTQFLEAQSKAQRLYITLAIIFSSLALLNGGKSYSWLFSLQILILVSQLLTTLPTAILAWTEPYINDEEEGE